MSHNEACSVPTSRGGPSLLLCCLLSCSAVLVVVPFLPQIQDRLESERKEGGCERQGDLSPGAGARPHLPRPPRDLAGSPPLVDPGRGVSPSPSGGGFGFDSRSWRGFLVVGREPLWCPWKRKQRPAWCVAGWGPNLVWRLPVLLPVGFFSDQRASEVIDS